MRAEPLVDEEDESGVVAIFESLDFIICLLND